MASSYAELLYILFLFDMQDLEWCKLWVTLTFTQMAAKINPDVTPIQ